MTIRVAINGFGRIGRMVVRAANKNPMLISSLLMILYRRTIWRIC